MHDKTDAIWGMVLAGSAIGLTTAVVVNTCKNNKMKRHIDCVAHDIAHGACRIAHKAGDGMMHIGRCINRIAR